ncbi:hypothetical protein ACOI1H_13760 [Loktanella sp. DJP18]|uniref:hypothetical protein n=1 Tax=Loktanella sp. DJP18 TaxID=3409788 RepID=UPI003BB5EC30
MKRYLTTGPTFVPGSLVQGGPDRVDFQADKRAHVQRNLGHKRVEATLAFYTEINENSGINSWQAYLADQKSRQPKGFKKKEQ